MPPDTQVKLLRALENREVTRVGGRRPVAVNVRVVSATNRAVERQVADGSLRLDLWYRLAVLVIDVPPLRERREDIPLLARELLGSPADAEVTLSAAALERLAGHSWPGNVRELRNVLERARLLARRRSGAGRVAEGGVAYRAGRGAGAGAVRIEARDVVLDGPLGLGARRARRVTGAAGRGILSADYLWQNRQRSRVSCSRSPSPTKRWMTAPGSSTTKKRDSRT